MLTDDSYVHAWLIASNFAHALAQGRHGVVYFSSRPYPVPAIQLVQPAGIPWREQPVSAVWELNMEFERSFGGKLRWRVRLQTAYPTLLGSLTFHGGMGGCRLFFPSFSILFLLFFSLPGLL